MTTYREMADKALKAKPEVVAVLAYTLLRIYEADRTKNNGLVTGEAVLCKAFSSEAKWALETAGVLEKEAA